MAYGVDTSNSLTRLFINEYIKAGGRKDLVCYLNYFSNEAKIEAITIGELIETLWHNAKTFFTPEEQALLQRLLIAINTQVDQEVIKNAEVQRLRFKRKIAKANQTRNSGEEKISK